MIYDALVEDCNGVDLTVPVKLLPKTNSFGGTSSFGVIVFVTDNLEESMSWSLSVGAALAWML